MSDKETKRSSRTIIVMATKEVVLSEHASKAYYAAIESGKALRRYQFKNLPHKGGT